MFVLHTKHKMSSLRLRSLLSKFTILAIFLVSIKSSISYPSNDSKFSIKEATIESLQTAFKEHKLTSEELVKFYLKQIKELNPILRAVIEVNPDALELAREADEARAKAREAGGLDLPLLHGIPILIKDNIATKDKLNNTAGSFALLGSQVDKEAGVVKRLRQAGAIILGKASMSEWAHFRSFSAPNGWSPRGGQGRNPYNLTADPCGSSSGPAIAVAANMAAVSLGTETDGSILCPSSKNSVVGIKPTVGLTSRAGVVPVSPRQDTVGPICRTVTDAVHVLDAIVGFDPYDSEATKKAATLIPPAGYTQFLKKDGLKQKRLGVVRNSIFYFGEGSPQDATFEQHLHTLGQGGAVLVDSLEIANADKILSSSARLTILLAEFKLSLNSYLNELVTSPAKSLADVISFNTRFPKEEMLQEYGQKVFVLAEATNGIQQQEKEALSRLEGWSRESLEKVMEENDLDAIVAPYTLNFSSVLAIGGFPGISVPAGYDFNGVPFGICFGGLKGAEPELIEIAYAFEQATKIREIPPEFSTNGLTTK